MAEQTTVPEPLDGAYVESGELLWVRDDVSTDEARRDGDGPAWTSLPADARWWLANVPDEPPRCWSEVAGLAPGPARRLYTQVELDAAVEAASYQRVGDHLREPGGYCRTCGEFHAETEWARIAVRAAEGGGSGAS